MVKEKTCKICGDTFTPTSNRQICCNKIIYKKCEVCGNKFEGKCTTSDTNKTCSSKCASILVKRNREASASNLTKYCKWCGKPFTPKSKRDCYCNREHYKICEVCGKEFKIDVRKNNTLRSCSKKCKKILQIKDRDFKAEHYKYKKTMMQKYGVSNPMKLDIFKESIKQTNLDKYGKEHYTQTKEYKEKTKETSLKKYGYTHWLKNEKILNKQKDTCLKKYGVENISQLKETQDKIKNKVIDTYGIRNIGQKNISNIDDWYKFIENSEKYIIETFGKEVTINQLCNHFNVTICSIYNNITDNAKYLIKRSLSIMEEDIIDYLNKLDSHLKIETHVRSIIDPYELDIYIPEFKLAIECNPTYTHNSSFSVYEEAPKSKQYHKMKTDRCEERGIFLFHIFGYEWEYKKDVIKSMLSNLLGKNKYKIYGRKCEIREVSSKIASQFQKLNHRQSIYNAKINLGLYYENELVSLMTFSKMRKTIGTGNDDLSDCWELVRFCNKINTSVIGGASKLFKYFIETYNPQRIRSFSDRAHTKGNLYQILGFKKLRMSDPGYVWVNLKDDKAYSRLNAQKHNIKKFLKDDLIDLSKTESQIMEEHGFAAVYDSGTICWEYMNNNI